MEWLKWLPVRAWDGKFRHTYHKGDWYGYVTRCIDNEVTDGKGGPKYQIQ